MTQNGAGEEGTEKKVKEPRKKNISIKSSSFNSAQEEIEKETRRRGGKTYTREKVNDVLIRRCRCSYCLGRRFLIRASAELLAVSVWQLPLAPLVCGCLRRK